MSGAQYAYVMKGMTKTFPGAQKPVLNNINLQFYFRARRSASSAQALGWRKAPHRADAAAAPESPTSCCSTSRPTISTPKRRMAGKAPEATIRAPC
jgi:hypothetical protein